MYALRRVPPSGDARLGLAVRTRAAQAAVARNRTRRRLREAFRRLAPTGGWDIVIVAEPEAATRTFQAMTEDLAVALRRVLEEEA